MRINRARGTALTAVGAVALAIVGSGLVVRQSIGSDHQQTALTELNPSIDITDVYVFPGSSDDRIVLAMTVMSPIVGNRTLIGGIPARFDPNALYQLKVDNNKDGREDLVLQFSFDQYQDGSQTVDVIGPVAPRDVGQFGVGTADGFVFNATPSIRRGAVGGNLTGNLPAVTGAAAGQIQVFTGLRDDPFFIDLEQFFRIIPDRRPTTTALSKIGGVVPAPPGTVAASWRPECTNGVPNPGQSQYATTFGCATDFLAGINALAIVVELPENQLTRGGDGEIGVWATISQ